MATLPQIALTFTPGLGPSLLRRLLAAAPQVPDADLFALAPSDLQRLLPGQPALVRALADREGFARAEAEMRFCERHHIHPLFFTDAGFPQRLNRAECTDAPVLLYALGSADLNAQRSIAVAGTRKATAYGCEATRAIVAGLAHDGPLVVSGLAYGIDTVAHTTAIEQGLPTVAVLGHGLDTIYPQSNRPLAERIIASGGALATEYPSGTPIDPRNFPSRNRIIAAMGDALLVPQSAASGGAIIAAKMALGYRRPLFAVPGRIDDPLSEGTNNLIATGGATITRSAADIESHSPWLAKPTVGQPTLFDDAGTL